MLIFEQFKNITDMSLHRKLLMLAILAAVIPYAVQAQEKQRKLEINVGISTPGMIEMHDSELSGLGLEYFGDIYYDRPLSNLDKESYNSTLYPCLSVEAAYKLAEFGFFKRLDLVGFVGLHNVYYEDFDMVNNISSKETATKLDILVGFRYNIIKKTYFNMYSQFLAGGAVGAKSGYWKMMSDKWSDSGSPTMQFTFLGFNVKLGRRESRLGAMVEFGYGSEYASSVLIFIPGVRTGLSYKF